ncbi:MAG TPA: signal peptide peptidase SppA [Syntrophales bacterium]|nr:signal peptide peptidase SppA [Syntrophales bacterium]
MRKSYFIIVLFLLILTVACGGPRIKLCGDETEPLKEFTLEGTGSNKILLIPMNGIITDAPKERFLTHSQSMVERVMSQLNKAEKDNHIKAVLFEINSPGGTITASDLLYHEISSFKERTGKKITVSMMDLATSGAYYVSLPADLVTAHPTTITGSVGVLFLQPKIIGLMEKVGISVDVKKFGKNKDMGTPFRNSTDEEQRFMQKSVDDMGERFIRLVQKHRKMNQQALDEISTARVFLADDALKLGLVDKVCYLSDTIRESKKLAGLAADARVIVYRRTEFGEDNYYNTSSAASEGFNIPVINIELSEIVGLKAGFYYLWPGSISIDR